MMKTLFHTVVLALSFAVGHVPVARAQENGTIRIVVPVPPGGPLDMTARLLADHLSMAWKQSVIVDNRPGGNTILGARIVAQSKPDGLTVLLATSSMASYAALMKNPGLDLHKDWTFVSMISRVPQYLAVSTESKVNTIQELAAKAKSRSLNYSAYGGTLRIMTEQLNRSLGITAEPILYSGAAPAVQALLRGDIDYMLEAMSTLKPLVAGSKLKVLAVTERTRVDAFREIPTVTELGVPGSDFGVWYGLFAPVGLSPALTEKFNKEVAIFTKSPKVRGVLEPLGFLLSSSTPDEMRQIAFRDEQTFQSMAKAMGLQPE